jgi:glycerol dehydrogenase
MNFNPVAVVVDTRFIARAPVSLLLAGIGDAITKKFEVSQCQSARGLNMYGGRGALAALALADLCYESVRRHSIGAIRSVGLGVPNDDLEHLVETTILLSGLCFENGGLSISHSMTRGLSGIPATSKALHGLQVAYGLLVQLVLEERKSEFLNELIGFYLEIGLPTSLADLGLSQSPTNKEIESIAQLTMTAPYVHNFQRAISELDIYKAILRVESKTF